MATTDSSTLAAPTELAGPSRSWAVLAAAGSAHILHDGMAALVYVMLPVWAAGFALTLTQAAMLKTMYGVALGLFQVPGSVLAEHIGERRLLVLGTAVAGAGYLAMGWSGGYGGLLVILGLIGAASSVQHPIASSLVATAFRGGRQRAAMSTYVFSGDVGKVALPGAAALTLGVFAWHYTTAGVGVLALLSALALLLALRAGNVGAKPPRRTTPAAPIAKGEGWGIADRAGFARVAIIATLDSAVRGGFTVLLPFLLIEKGAPVEATGLALTLMFAGGGAGKFVIGTLAARVGVKRTVVLCEAFTAVGIVLAVQVPLEYEYLLLPLLGIAQNGVSSVLIGTVADLCTPERQARAFALLYAIITGSIGIAPVIYGALGEHAGIPMACWIMAATLLPIAPTALRLRE